MKVARKFKRGPRKGDGGRPKGEMIRIYDDPDRLIIETARWLRKDPREQRTKALLQALDFLFTPHDCIGLAIERVEYGALGITNTTPLRLPTRNSPARKLHSAPGGAALLKSRVQNLQEKMIRFQMVRPNKKENLWRGLFHLALDFLAHGEVSKGVALLNSAGIDLPLAARKRFVEILHAMFGEAAISR
jgi:hypothetical protein